MKQFGGEYDYLFKVLMVGEAAVGKSSLLIRFAENSFSESYMSTIGVDFRIKGVNIDDKLIKLQIWDTAGQERFKSITHTYYKGSHGVIIIFDLTDLQSFKNLDNWIQEIKENADQNVIKILIGNKSDLAAKRQIPFDTAKQFAEANQMEYIETSAKNGENVENMFLNVAKEVKKRVITPDGANDGKSDKSSLKNPSTIVVKNKSCC